MRRRPQIPLLQILLALAVTTACARAAALPTDGLTAPLVDLRIPSLGAPAPLPSDNIYWTAPMTQWNISNRFGVGTDNNDCRQKDATAARTKTSPPTGYLQFRYTVPAAGYFYYRTEVNAPDSLANSMWVQFDNSTSSLEWSTVKSTTWAPDIITYAPTLDETLVCFPQASGSHTVRLYAREAGTVISTFAVYAAPQLTVVWTDGCDPACTARDNSIRIKFKHFCGHTMHHSGLVKLNGKPCDRLVDTGEFGEMQCDVPNSVVSEASHTNERILRLSLDVPNPDPATAARQPYIHVPTDVVFAVEPPTQFPAYGYALIAIAAVLALAGIIYTLVIRPWLRNRFAPRTAGSGVGICFVAMPPTCASPAVHRDFCARARPAATANSCHVFKRIGSSALAVVAARPSDAVRFAVELQAASEAKSERYVELEKEHAAAVLQEKNRKANKKSSKKKAPAVAVTTSKNDAEDEETAASRAASVRPLIAVHCGNVTVTFDRETDEYDYTGAAVDEGAVLVDLAHPGQLLLSHPVVASLETNGIVGASGETLDLETALIPYAVRILNPNDQPASGDTAAEHESADDDDADEDIGGPQRVDDKDSDRRLAKDPSSSSLAETADDASVAGTQVYTLRAGAFTNVDFTFDDSESSGNAGGLGVAAQLRQAHGGLATAKGTVLLVDPGVDLASHRSAVIYEQVIAQIATIVEKRGGTLQAVHNSLLVFTFNIRSPVVAHRRKAALAATEIQSARFGSHIQPAGALTSGSVTFGTTEGEHGVVAGPALDAALRLLHHLKTVTRQTAGRRSAFMRRTDSMNNPIEDGESNASDDTADSSSQFSASRNSSHSRGSVAGRSDDSGAGGLLAMRWRSHQIRFVCDGPAYVDLCDAFDMVVLHARTAAEIEERHHRLERHRSHHGSVVNGNNHNSSAALRRPGGKPPASKASAPTPAVIETKDVVVLAGIVGVKVMSDAEEWQYDLANIEAGSPYAAVSSAFLAVARGDADSDDLAERVLARFRETAPSPMLRIPVVLLQDFVNLRRSHKQALGSAKHMALRRSGNSSHAIGDVTLPGQQHQQQRADSVTFLPFVMGDDEGDAEPAPAAGVIVGPR